MDYMGVQSIFTQIYDEKTAKDGTPILLKTCCFNDIEKQILDLPEACRCRTTPQC
jgi:hypothetical protein